MTASPLLRQVRALFTEEPDLAVFFGYDPGGIDSDADLLAGVLAACIPEGPARGRLRAIAAQVFAGHPDACAAALDDLTATAGRDADPGGRAATLHFAGGYHLLLSYRLTHALWHAGRRPLALALKGQFTRALGAEIWPQAQIGRGIWIDHGIGVVIGQTAVIEDDVSLWHGVTLGSTLADLSDSRHPIIRRGATIGAGAIILGGIEIGAGAIIGAGAVVTRPVPPGALVTGPRAEERNRRPGMFAGFPTLAELEEQK